MLTTLGRWLHQHGEDRIDAINNAATLNTQVAIEAAAAGRMSAHAAADYAIQQRHCAEDMAWGCLNGHRKMLRARTVA